VVDLTVTKEKEDVRRGASDKTPSGPIPSGAMPPGALPVGASAAAVAAAAAAAAAANFDPNMPPAMLYQRQQEELRRFYSVYSGDEQVLPVGVQPPPGMGQPLFPPSINSPSGSSWSGGPINGPKGSPLERKLPMSSAASHPATQSQAKTTMPGSASSPKLRPPSVDRKESDHHQHRRERERERERERDKEREKERDKERESSQDRNKFSDGVKPTMETHGPPPPPGLAPGSIPGGAGLPYSYLYPYGLGFDPSRLG